MANTGSKRNREKKTEVISFRVLPEVAELYRTAIAESSLSAAEFYAAGIAGLAIGIDAFETGIEHGRMQVLGEIAKQLYKHKDHTDRYRRSLDQLFDEITGKGKSQ